MRTIRIGNGGSVTRAPAAARRQEEPPTFAGSQLAAKFLTSTRRWGGAGNQRGFLEAYKRIPILRTCIDLLASLYVEPEWTLYAPKGEGRRRDIRARLKGATPRERQREVFRMQKADELVEVEESAVRDAFLGGRPGLWSGVERRRLEMVHRLCAGESFSIFERQVSRSGLSAPVGQIIVPPTWVFSTPIPGQEWFEIRNQMGMRVQMYGTPGVPMSEVAWRKTLDPLDPSGRGTGLVQVLATELETAELLSQHAATKFYNNARPDLVVIGEFGGEEARLDAEDAWLSANQGVGRSSLPYFVDVMRQDGKGTPLGGNPLKIDIKELDTTFKDLQLVDLRRSLDEVVRMVAGRIPAELLGMTGNANRATTEHARYMVSQGWTQPELEGDRRWTEDQLMPLYGEQAEGWMWEYESPVQEDREYVRQVMVSASHAFSVDEHRNVAGFEPLPNKEGEGFFVGLGATYVRSLPEAGFSAFDVPPVPPPAGREPETAPSFSGEEDAPEEPEPGVQASTGPRWVRTYEPGRRHEHVYPHRPKLAPHRVTKAQVPGNKAIDRIAKRLAPRAAAVLLKAAEQAKGKVDVAALEEAVSSGALEKALSGWGSDEVKRAEVRRLLGLDGLTSGMSKVGAVLRGILDEAGKSTATHLAQQLGEEATYDVGAKAVRGWLRDRQKGLVQWIEEAAVQMASGLLGRDKAAERAASETASRLRDHLGLSDRLSSGVDNQDGDPVVRTKERAAAFGREQAFDGAMEGQRSGWVQAQEQGVLPPGVLRIWVTQRDDRVCPICYRLDGQKRGLDEPFDTFEEDTNGDGIADSGPIQLMNPGLEAHEGCRCPVILLTSSQ